MIAVINLDAGAVVHTGERIAHRPRFDANSSFERPRHARRPLTNARSVTDCARPPRPFGFTAAGFGSATPVNSTLSNVTRLISPAPSMRTSAELGRWSRPFHHRDERVLRGRVDRQVGNRDAGTVRAEQRGDLRIDAFNVLGARDLA